MAGQVRISRLLSGQVDLEATDQHCSAGEVLDAVAGVLWRRYAGDDVTESLAELCSLSPQHEHGHGPRIERHARDGTLVAHFDWDHPDCIIGEHFPKHFTTLLETALDAPHEALGNANLATSEERQLLLERWNDDTEYPAHTLFELFTARAEADGERAAVLFQGDSTSYRDLLRGSRRFAGSLAEAGVTRGRRVALLMSAGPEQLEAFLGLLALGGVAVWLDPAHPTGRLVAIAEESGAAHLVTEGEALEAHGDLAAHFCQPGRVSIDAAIASKHQGATPAVSVSPEDPCYVVYTSGSTGQPKGIEQTHKAFCQFLGWQSRELDIGPGERFVQWASITYDAGYCEIFGSLCFGATLVMAPPEVRYSPTELLALCRETRATILQVVPSFCAELLDALETVADGPRLPDLSRLLLAGEVLPRDLATRLGHLLPECEVYNLYGPTESVLATFHRLDTHETSGGSIPVGRAIDGRQVLILDPRSHLAPIGVPGELHIRSAYLTNGYVNRPTENDRRFVQNPLHDDFPDRTFRTGDLARFKPTGEIEFLGRRDALVKIRGQRVELGEIEAALRALPAVREAVVVVTERPRKRGASVPMLVAYFTADEELELTAVRDTLARRLPAHMVPQRLIPLSTLPRNANKKLDRTKLPAPDHGRPIVATSFAPATTETEHWLAELWQELLGLDEVGIDDLFADLGGTSLLLTQALAGINSRVPTPVPLVRLYELPTIRSFGAWLGRRERELPSRPPSASAPRMRRAPAPGEHFPIAIIGMAGRFPGSADVPTLWRNLLAGQEGIVDFDEAVLRRNELDWDRLKDDPDYVRRGGPLEDIERWDARFFGYNPRQAALLDPQQRLWLETAWHALEDANLDPSRFPGAVSVFAGAGSVGGYLFENLARDRSFIERYMRNASIDAYETLLGNDREYLASRTAYHLGLRGPAVNVQAACATSLVAIVQACQSLWQGESDAAIAGGVSLQFPQERGYLHQEGAMRSRDGSTRAFDAQASGTVFTSGVGAVVVEPLDRARAAGRPVYAVIRGAALNNDGAIKASFTAPSVAGQAEVITAAQEMAEVDPRTIGYVEAHGTATPMGDPIEVEALTRAFRQKTADEAFCALGSLKSNVGHMTAAAGVGAFIKTALVVKHGELPPSLHFETPNPHIDFAKSPFYVATERAPFPGTGPRRAGVSSFGVGGTNAHIIIEEAPRSDAPRTSGRTHQLLSWSAKNEASLRASADALGRHLAAAGAEPAIGRTVLADAAHTLRHGRQGLARRALLVVADPGAASQALSTFDPESIVTVDGATGDAHLAFMFPGQGSQYVGMARQLYEQEPSFRAIVDRCSTLLEEPLGLDLRSLLFAAGGNQGGQDDRDAERAALQLTETRFAQPALFVIEYALAELWVEWGVTPEVLIGHSIGEFAAACLAGVFTLDDALTLVAERGRLMQTMPRGDMAALRVGPEDLRALLGDGVELAAHNAPELSVVSGAPEAMAAFVTRAAAAGHEARTLRTSHAFHSEMMDPILDPFRAAFDQTSPRPPRIPLVSGLTGALLTDAQATSGEYWAQQLRHTVRFNDGIQRLLGDPRRALLEVGPGMALSTSARRQRTPHRPAAVVDTLGHPNKHRPAQVSMLYALGRLAAAGVPVDFSAFEAREDGRLAHLPGYAFDRARHWVDAPSPGQTPGAQSAPRSVDARNAIDAQASSLESIATVPGAAPRGVLVNQLRQMLTARTGIPVEASERDTSFVDLGFDSLSLTQLSAEVREVFGVRVPFRELFDQLDTLAKLAGRIEGDVGVSAPPKQPTVPAPVPPAPDEGSFALTPSQQEMLLPARLDDDAQSSLNQGRVLRMVGPVDGAQLSRAFDLVIERHEALRVTISSDGSEHRAIRQLPTLVRELLEDPTDGPAWARISDLMTEPFDLTDGPLVRAVLLQHSATRHTLVFVAHHLICDGRSVGVVLTDLAQAYTALVHGEAPELGPATSFRAFVARPEEQRDDSLTYWAAEMTPLPPRGDMPLDRPRGATRTYAAATARLETPGDLMDGIRSLARSRKTSVFSVLLTAYQVLLSRLQGQRDIVVGIPFAASGIEDMPGLVGHTVNFLPLRSRLDDDPTFAAHLTATRDKGLAAFDHNQTTYGEIIAALPIQRDAARLPLVENSFNVARTLTGLRFAGINVALEDPDKEALQFDLALDIDTGDDGMELAWHYNTALFEGETVVRWLGHYEALLRGAIAEPHTPVSRLPLMSAGAQRDAERGLSGPDLAYDTEAAAYERFLEMAARFPNRDAVIFGESTLTYRELATRAKQVARCLREMNVTRGALVAVYLDRTPDLIVALLGTWMAGGAYVPIDPIFPPGRIRMIFEDASPEVLITHEALGEELDVTLPTLVMDRDMDRERLEAAAPELPEDAATGDDTAYVIFTSGSTGRPKGVSIRHRAVVNLLDGMRRSPGLREGERLLAVTTISFDIAVVEIFLPLTTGATVDLASNDLAMDFGALGRRLEETRADVMQATPATWRALVETGWKGHPTLRIFCGGEALPPDLARALETRGAELWNLYGPTETTVWSAASHIAPGGPVTLGVPLTNTRLYVVDLHGVPQPPGVSGELWIGGGGVAVGYYGQPELTAQKFIDYPFGPEGEARVYCTGDLCRINADESVVFLGRLDHQVKVRGFRIELGEIESQLSAHPGVRQAVLVAQDDPTGDSRLVAYLLRDEGRAAGAEVDGAALREALREVLPLYMLPSHFVFLDAYPLTPNGKVDRGALPPPTKKHTAQAPAPESDRVPRTPVEELLQRLYGEVLGIDRPGVHESFFDLGGHSLQALRVIHGANRSGLALLPTLIFQYPTIAALAAVTTTRRLSVEGADPTLVPLRPEGELKPVYFPHSLPGDLLHYAQLIRVMDERRPAYGFQSLGLSAPEQAHHSIEAMAAHYVAALRRMQAAGPYHLAGWCFGGVVALEMAQQLRAQGEKVGFVGLLESFPYQPKDAAYYARQLRLLTRMGTEAAPVLRSRASRFLGRRPPPPDPREVFALDMDTGPFKHRPYVYTANSDAADAYHSRYYEGRITVFKAQDTVDEIHDPDYEWGRFARDVKVVELGGNHKNIIHQPHVQELAAAFDRALEEAERDGQ